MPRFREVYPELAQGLSEFKPGRHNAITDVPGVRVGHATVRDARKGFMSGVTAIWPHKDAYYFRPRASGHVLHGAGEMTGLHQVLEWGVIETPILLTSTLNVGRVHDAVVEYMARKHPRMGVTEDVIIPVVGECDDSHMSRSPLRPVGKREVFKALDGATPGPVAEGSVGAGAGMITFDFKGGIGTSSRLVPVGEKGRGGRTYRLGVLLNANVGVRRQMRVGGAPVGKELRDRLMPEEHPERSVIVVMATDAPLRPDQLRRLCVRAGLGLGRVGSFAGHASGELIVGFSTTLGEPKRGPGVSKPLTRVENLRDSFLNPFYEAAVECVEESLLNALTANSPAGAALGGGRSGSVDGRFIGRDGHTVYGFPLASLADRLS